VSFYIEKVGSPGSATVRVTNDSSGSPGATSITTGTLNAAQVTGSYGWVTVVFPTGTSLISGTTYWIVIDASADNNNYLISGANSAYGNGQALSGKYGSSWGATSPAGLDAYFRFYIGGENGSITNVLIGTAGVGDAWAHTISASTIQGSNY